MMEKQNKSVIVTRGNLIIGAFLILFGIVLLLGQVFDVSLGGYLYPFAVIVPGVFLFLLAMSVEEKMGQALAIISGIVTMVGFILLVQSITHYWGSWTYAWALIAPTGAGIGLWLFGVRKERPDLVKSGKDLTGIGLAIFVVAAVFFEFVMDVNGNGLGRNGLPVLLIVVGLFLLIRNLRHGWQKA
jgi:hypothetical protein